ncbi:MAG: hypothetical protein M1818_005918 [Claussenomyces sp. TS43310]|nr:MAG: hypothetical protein M1818_005918 [Claussenomyces sp. TS43310]
MSSYLSGLLTTTTSRYASLRSLIPSSASENDGDTPDDTHLCRVLRAYYVEKGRSFPSWLPPDPKSAQPVQPVYNTPSNVGAGYGGLNHGGGGNKLGSLWDSQPAANNLAPPSLRQQGRGASANSMRGGLSARDPYSRSQTTPPVEHVQARPLPSQRAGSYQTTGAMTSTPPPGAGAGSTAQERLKARLWGAARAASPNLTAGASSGPAKQPGLAGVVRQATFEKEKVYNNAAGMGTGGGTGGYGDGSGSRGAGRSGDRPFVAATAPWASTEDQFSGGSYGGGGGRTGISNGSASASRAGGLPSGPRSMR